MGIGPGNPNGMIGMATSADGVLWEKYNNPLTTAAQYASSDPVFRQADTGQGDVRIKYPRVRVTPDGCLLFYHISLGNLSHSQINLATGTDGIYWANVQEEPVFGRPAYGAQGFKTVFLPNVVYANDTYYMFMELSRGVHTRINLATHEGRLFESDPSATAPNPMLEARRTDAHGVPMVLIPAGPFEMGTPSGASSPQHTVVLDDYYIDQYEVTNPTISTPTSRHVRVVRGGSWYSSALYTRSYHRNAEFPPTATFSNLGFRCAATP